MIDFFFLFLSDNRGRGKRETHTGVEVDLAEELALVVLELTDHVGWFFFFCDLVSLLSLLSFLMLFWWLES